MITIIRRYFSIPLITLLIANIFPLYGVLELGWGVFELIFLFWMENVVIGLFNVFKMLVNKLQDMPMWFGKLFLMPFFIFHYGIFTLVHGIFVIALFGPESLQDIQVDGLMGFFIYSDELFANSLETAVTLLLVSHAVSFYFDYIRNGEYERIDLKGLMIEPYGRIVVLHIGLIASGFLLMALDQPTAGLILLIFLKIGLDAKMLIERERGVDGQRQRDTDKNG